MDRRVLNTQMRLREHFLLLLREKSVQDISVSELCRLAGINRKTFYAHYENTEDLLCCIEDALFMKIRTILAQVPKKGISRKRLENIYRIFWENQDSFIVFFEDHNFARFCSRLCATIHDECLRLWKNMSFLADDMTLELLFAFCTESGLDILRKWMLHDAKENLTQVTALIDKVCRHGMAGFVDSLLAQPAQVPARRMPDREIRKVSCGDKVHSKVLQTKQKLEISLLALMETKSIGAITPTDLCRHAKINRNTFYAHFTSPRQLLRSIEDRLYDDICPSIEDSLEHGDNLDLLTVIHQFFLDNRHLCIPLFSHGENNYLLNRIAVFIRNKITDERRKEREPMTDGQFDLLYGYFTRGGIAVTEKWAQSGMKMAPRQLAQLISRVCKQGMEGFLVESGPT